LCYSHVPQVKRDKLDKRAKPGVFIGYTTISKVYKIFQPQTGKILISKEVHFMRMKNGSGVTQRRIIMLY